MALERLRSVPTENSSPDERILERPGAQAGSLSAEYLPRGRPHQRAMTDQPAARPGTPRRDGAGLGFKSWRPAFQLEA